MTALRAEGCGGGFAFGHTSGVRVHRVQKVQKVQRVVVSPLRAMSMKSALRIHLSVSDGMIGILVIGSLRGSPLSGCAGLFFPHPGTE